MGNYNEEFKKKIVRLHLEEGQTLKSLADEYGVSRSALTYWVKRYREECQNDPEAKEEYDLMRENLRLKKELEEIKKENSFLKKAAAFFAKEL